MSPDPGRSRHRSNCTEFPVVMVMSPSLLDGINDAGVVGAAVVVKVAGIHCSKPRLPRMNLYLLAALFLAFWGALDLAVLTDRPGLSDLGLWEIQPT